MTVDTDTGPDRRRDRNAARRDAARIKEQRALDLRLAGATFQQIAEALGYANRSSARRAFERALEAEIRIGAEARETLRAEQAARLERLLRSAWPAAVRGDAKARGDVIRLLERQARLLGLDAPVNLRVTDGLDGEIEALLEEMERLAREEAAAMLTADGGETP